MELTLFIIMAIVAIISAAMMLISENAVYSALFLILNFACIAFFFLLLNAAFLAMVQIAVYAGAIMVLFLFVIMLLGAERVPIGEPVRFRWLTPVAVVLALVFLVTASAAIIGGKIELTEPRESEPHIRVVHAVDGVDAFDVYMDGEVLAKGLAFGASSGFEALTASEVQIEVFEAGADHESADPLVEQHVESESTDVVSLAIVGVASDLMLVKAKEDLSSHGATNKLRLTVINAMPKREAVDVLNDDDNTVLVEHLGYGEASESLEISASLGSIGLYLPGDTEGRIAVLDGDTLNKDTSVLAVFLEQRQPDNSFVDVVVNVDTDTLPAFGSPAHVGHLLFRRYVLPFELVALLLLVAMIGAIVLTHESLGPGRQIVRRLADPPAGLEQPIIGKSRD